MSLSSEPAATTVSQAQHIARSYAIFKVAFARPVRRIKTIFLSFKHHYIALSCVIHH